MSNDTTLIASDAKQLTVRKNYLAKYSVEYFPRKRIASYALWAISVKENSRYPKIPSGYGKTATQEQAFIDLSDWCTENCLTIDDIRQEGCFPWRLVKDLLDGKSGAEFFARSITRADSVKIIDNSNLVYEQSKSHKAVTDSLLIAKTFGKRHDNVIKAIEKLPNDDFWLLHFKHRDYIDSRGKIQKMYEMTWKGFSMLVMGFTGNKAYEWKKRFLDAFEAMGDEIFRHRQQQTNQQWIETRKNGKIDRRLETDVIYDFIAYAKNQGGTPAGCERYYENISTMENKALFILEQKYKNLRDVLGTIELLTIQQADRIVSKALKDGMNDNLHYKAIYILAKSRVELFAEIRGREKLNYLTSTDHTTHNKLTN